MSEKETWLDKFVNNLPTELHAIDPVVGKYSALGPGTKHKERLEEYIKTGDKNVLFKNDLDRAAIFHDSAYSKYKTSVDRKAADEQFIKDAQKIARDKSKGGYERAWALLASKIFEKKLKIGAGLNRVQRKFIKENLL